MDNRTIANNRKEYQLCELKEEQLKENPIDFFKDWYREAMEAVVPEYNAMIVSTVDIEGRPSSRVVLLKSIEEEGFVFFSNYNSQKAKELNDNKWVAANFYWSKLERQIRIQGEIEKISEEASEAYFSIRPRGSQLGAWISNQSEVINSREVLENKYKEIEAQYKNQDVPKPPHWGGFLIKVQKIEFWQGRPNRLHDRFLYEKDSKKEGWKIVRLSP